MLTVVAMSLLWIPLAIAAWRVAHAQTASEISEAQAEAATFERWVSSFHTERF